MKENRTEIGLRHGLRFYVGSIGHKVEEKHTKVTTKRNAS
jgi:hypothetical protein